MIRTVERRGDIELCCYSWSGWAVFVYRPTKPDEPDWKCVANGKWSDIWPKYSEMRG